MQHLAPALGEQARRQILEGGHNLADGAPRRDVIRWTREMLKRLELHAGSEDLQRLLSECACQYPHSGLAGDEQCSIAVHLPESIRMPGGL